MNYTVYAYDEQTSTGKRANEVETDYMTIDKAYDVLLESDDIEFEIVSGKRPGWKRVKCIAAYDDEEFQVEPCVAYKEVAAL